MTIHKFVNEMQEQHKIIYDKDELYNKTRKYIQNVFSAIGVGLDEFRKAMGVTVPYAYNVSPQLQEILKKHIIDCSFPTLKQMERFIEKNNSHEIVKITDIIKCFLDENFTEMEYTILRNRVKAEIKKLEDKLTEIHIEYGMAANQIKKNSLFALSVSNCSKYICIAKNMLGEPLESNEHQCIEYNMIENSLLGDYQKIFNLVKIHTFLYQSRLEIEKTNHLNKINFQLY